MVLFIIIVLILLIVLVASYLFFVYACSRDGLNIPGLDPFGGTGNPFQPYMEKVEKGAKWLEDAETEEIRIKSYDGIDLVAHLLKTDLEPKRVAICAHGYRASWSGDFSRMAVKFMEDGCDVLLIEERAHGMSGGKYICFGTKEKFDILSWCRYIEKRYGNTMPIYLSGLSMGCATVLMAAGLDLPMNVKGIVADCGYTSPREIQANFYKLYTKGLPTFPILNLFAFWCKTVAGFDADENTKEALKNTKLPIFFVHGGADDFVPTAMSVENFNSYEGPKELYIAPNQGHATSFLMDEEMYMHKMKEFFEINKKQ